MQRTSKYQLPQWEMNDRIMMEDFNDAMSKIDAGMAAKDYHVGTYQGTGSAHTVVVGFRPSAVLITRQQQKYSSTAGCLFNMFTDEPDNEIVQVQDNGFSLSRESSGQYPPVNRSGSKYYFIAFR